MTKVSHVVLLKKARLKLLATLAGSSFALWQAESMAQPSGSPITGGPVEQQPNESQGTPQYEGAPASMKAADYSSPPKGKGIDWAPTMNLKLGHTAHVSGKERDYGLVFDVNGGVHWPIARGWLITSEIGYRFADMTQDGHFFTVSLAPAAQVEEVYFFRYTPTFLVGKQYGTAFGIRNGLAVSAAGVLGIEGSHAYIHSDKPRQELALQVTFDPVFAGFLVNEILHSVHGRPLLVEGVARVSSIVTNETWA